MKSLLIMAVLVALAGCDGRLEAGCVDAFCDGGSYGDRDGRMDGDGEGDTDDGGEGGAFELAPPTGLVGMHTADGYRLAWSDESSREDGFRLERRSGRDGDYTPLTELAPNTTEYVDTGRDPDGEHWYRLSAFRGEERSDFVTLDSSLLLWTYIRIYDYDDVWGMERSPAEEAATLEQYIREDTAAASFAANLSLVCLGDAHGDGGSFYAAGGPSTELIAQPELDMADVSTYERFFDWVLEHHPGQRYVVEYWGHGGGAAYPDGTLGFDETSGHGGLSPRAMNDVLGYLTSRTGRPVDLLFLCTCLNGMVENAYEWRRNVSWLVAGETTVGCGYTPFQVVLADEGLSPAELAAATVDGYRNVVAGEGFNAVYSAVDTEHVASLASALDELARALLAFIDAGAGNGETVRIASGQAQAMGSAPGDFATAYVDLYDLCREISGRVTDETIDAACEEIMTLLDGPVVADFAASDPGLYEEAFGLSIFHPNPRIPSYWPGAPEYYDGHALSIDTLWDEYLFALYPPS